MTAIVGHTNMDLDCLGSIALARILHPDAVPVRSSLIHPVAKNLYNLYKDHLNLSLWSDLKGETIDEVIIVDTRSAGRLKEYFPVPAAFPGRIRVYDHHPADSLDIPSAVVCDEAVGANTTLLGMLVMEAGLKPGPEDATIALTGIYADTGNFTHENVSDADFRVAGFLLERGASLALVKTFLQTLKEDVQIGLFHEMLNRISYRTVNGHMVAMVYMELEKQVGGLGAVVEKVFDVEGPDALFAVLPVRKEGDVLLIARSQKRDIDLNAILGRFGGGGHVAASSALVKGAQGAEVLSRLEDHLSASLKPALRAEDIMSRDAAAIRDSWSLLEASLYLETQNLTGAPVLSEEGALRGFLTLRDIMKGRKAGQMKAPVSAYMIRKVITGKRDMPIREIESLFFNHGIGHLPLVEDGRVIGVVTRNDYLRTIGGGEAASGAPVGAAPGAPNGAASGT